MNYHLLCDKVPVIGQEVILFVDSESKTVQSGMVYEGKSLDGCHVFVDFNEECWSIINPLAWTPLPIFPEDL